MFIPNSLFSRQNVTILHFPTNSFNLLQMPNPVISGADLTKYFTPVTDDW
jgi:hypothetical protein